MGASFGGRVRMAVFEDRSHTVDGEYDAQKSHMHNISLSTKGHMLGCMLN